jgi:murein L,D-transpeptidase YcbB/YkuD
VKAIPCASIAPRLAYWLAALALLSSSLALATPPAKPAPKAPASAPAPTPSPLSRQIQTLLESSPAIEETAPAEPGAAELPSLYRERNFQALWIAKGQPTARATVLRGLLAAADEEGLRPEDYQPAAIGRLWGKPDLDSQARLDLLLTRNSLHYALDLSRGRNAARHVELAESSPEPAKLPAALRKALDAPGLAHALKQQAPQHGFYQMLKRSLQDYRNLAQNGGWPQVPAGPDLQAGMSDPRIPLLRKRLALTEPTKFSPDNASSTRYDAALESAVRHFQKRHSLPDDGVIGAGTLAALNVPAEQRVHQIALNLERWRWLPVDTAGRQIWVNIPSFALLGLNNGAVELSMPVVVGKIDQQTPAFDERLEYLEFNPNWRVPSDIVLNEYLPELRKDPTSLAKKHLRIFLGGAKDAPEVDPRSVDWRLATPAQMERYVFRQDPGPWNALGTVKFMFPNKYNVYLHDTSEPRFFAKQRRAYSHGCVRVSRPYDLASWVLAKEETPWSLDRVQAAVASGDPLNVPLAKPMPVHLVYRTAWADENGNLYFPPDIYQRDEALAAALSGP